MANTFRFYLPCVSLFGAGCVQDLSAEIAVAGHKKCLLITDASMKTLGIAEKICSLLQQADLKTVVYSDVCPNPTTDNVQEALAMYRTENCDGIVTLGGGSAHDCGKAASILVTNGGACADYLGTTAPRRGCDVFAINTTAGTSSEITTTYVITDTKTHRKMVFEDSNCLAAVAVNDPELLLTLPPSLTATTGMDAFTHALECYVSTFSAPVTTELALCALRVIAKNLKNSVENPSDIRFREGMATGQYIAGMAFGNGGVGIAHSLAHALGGFYNIPHGLANAVLLPHVVRFNSRAAAAQYAQAFACVKAAEPAIAGGNLADWIENFNKSLGICHTLQTLGVPKEGLAEMAAAAAIDVCTATNPVQPTCEELTQIYLAAWGEIKQ